MTPGGGRSARGRSGGATAERRPRDGRRGYGAALPAAGAGRPVAAARGAAAAAAVRERPAAAAAPPGTGERRPAGRAALCTRGPVGGPRRAARVCPVPALGTLRGRGTGVNTEPEAAAGPRRGNLQQRVRGQPGELTPRCGLGALRRAVSAERCWAAVNPSYGGSVVGWALPCSAPAHGGTAYGSALALGRRWLFLSCVSDSLGEVLDLSWESCCGSLFAGLSVRRGVVLRGTRAGC